MQSSLKILKEKYQSDSLSNHLKAKKPIVLEEIQSKKENFSTPIIIPPLNTDIRFSDHLPKKTIKEKFMSTTPLSLNKPHIFSWTLINSDDTPETVEKKKLIRPVSAQFACGCCWALALADAISDCFVVSGAVNWSPNISATYLMAAVPVGELQNMCFGGNPAGVAKYLSQVELADSTCIDYSWCLNDQQLCRSVSSAHHFDAETLATKLNSNIPSPSGCFFGDVKKYVYTIDAKSKVCSLQDDNCEAFRNTIKSHILQYGPVIGGFAVLQNFITGNFTNPKINQGIYFDRVNYESDELIFDDSQTDNVLGLHAVTIVGWGIADNIQFDTNSVGTVPFWICRNSWGTDWGNMKGCFKIAMYPFNKVSQFDKEVNTSMGGPIGSMILIRATQKPKVTTLKQIKQTYANNIKRLQPDQFYQKTAFLQDVQPSSDTSSTVVFWIILLIIIPLIVAILYLKQKQAK